MQRWTDDEVETLKQMYPRHLDRVVADELDRSKSSISNKATSLGLSKDENYQIRSQIHERGVPEFEDKEFAHFIAGFVAGEGCFTYNSRNNRDSTYFQFRISMSEVDSDILEDIQDFFGVGEIYHHERDNENWEDEERYAVVSAVDLGSVIIPFFDQYGFYNAHKQEQYDEWRTEFVEEYNVADAIPTRKA